MAPQIKNNFVQSKMNKDLDDRLLSAGEYRDALNVNISRSEGDDVGALENILGNSLQKQLTGDYNLKNIQIIGYVRSEVDNSAIFFLTDYTDESEDNLSNPAPYGANCFIVRLEIGGEPVVLVSGRFLNFSKTHKVLGVDILEDLLYFTDNRNQPRKINWKTALEDPSYYSDEDHISVAKYYPYKTPILKDEIEIINPVGSGTPIIEWWNDGFPGSDKGYSDCSTYYYINDPTEGRKIWTNLKVGMEVLGFETKKIDNNETVINSFSKPRFRAFIVERFVTQDGDNTLYYIKINTDPLAENPKTAKGPFDDAESDPYNGNLKSIKFGFATSQNQYDQFLFPHAKIEFAGHVSGNEKSISTIANSWSSEEILPGMQITSPGLERPVEILNSLITRSSSDGRITSIRLDLNRDFREDKNTKISTGDTLYISYENPNYTGNWPGDQDLLSDKFSRFAYRFKFDDGEYSLISPFTQPAFIPKQNGYIVTEGTLAIPGKDDDPDEIIYEETDQSIAIASSTVIQSFENSVNNVVVRIPFEYKCSELKDKLKVKEVDILYHDGGLAIYVLESISIEDSSFSENDTKFFDYNFQSKKPFKVLPESETIRVFDKVPVRAKSQSIAGNRIIYGNILDKHTPPKDIKYNVKISEKFAPGTYTKPAENYDKVDRLTNLPSISYPQHTVKQNRSYQVGIVLSDRYGRQSDVVLSEFSSSQVVVDVDNVNQIFDASTTYHPYADNDTFNVSEWRGDSIKVLFRDGIPLERFDEPGYPGLYKPITYKKMVDSTEDDGNIQLNGIDDFDKYGNIDVGDILFGETEDGIIEKSVVSQIKINQDDPNKNGIYVQGLSSTSNYADGAILTFESQGNVLGWHAYKIVVKQQAQDFYNVYLGQVTDINTEAQVVTGGYGSGINYNDFNVTSLISDNVNKVPADLTEVSPLQTQFGTSNSILYPRVGAHKVAGETRDYANQFYLGQKGASISAYGRMTELGLQVPAQTEQNEYPTSQGIWSASNNPTCIILGMSDGESLGIEPYKTSKNSLFACFEVKPVESRIEIFWETSTTGLISDLNNLIAGGPSSEGVIPLDPDAVPPSVATGYKYTSCDDALYPDDIKNAYSINQLTPEGDAFTFEIDGNERTFSLTTEVPIEYADEQPLVDDDTISGRDSCPPPDAVFGAQILVCDSENAGAVFLLRVRKSAIPSGVVPGTLYQSTISPVYPETVCWFYQKNIETIESDVTNVVFPPASNINIIGQSTDGCQDSPCSGKEVGYFGPQNYSWNEKDGIGDAVNNAPLKVYDSEGNPINSSTLEVEVVSVDDYEGESVPTYFEIQKVDNETFNLLVKEKVSFNSTTSQQNPHRITYKINDPDNNIENVLEEHNISLGNSAPILAKAIGRAPVGSTNSYPASEDQALRTSGTNWYKTPPSDREDAENWMEDFYVNTTTSGPINNASIIVWSQTEWNSRESSSKDSPTDTITLPYISIISRSSNGMTQLPINDNDSGNRNLNSSRLKNLTITDFEVTATTCKVELGDNGFASIKSIGDKDDTNDFQNFLDNKRQQGAGTYGYPLTTSTGGKFPVSTTNTRNGFMHLQGDFRFLDNEMGWNSATWNGNGDKRAGILLQVKYKLKDFGGLKSNEFVTRCVVYKGS